MSFLRANAVRRPGHSWHRVGTWLRALAQFNWLSLIVISLLCVQPAAAADATPKTVRVVMDNNYPPFVMERDGGLQGILVDQWRLWEVKTGIKVELVGTRWSEALQRMRAGEFDVLDTVFETVERTGYLAFSKPYKKIDVPIFFTRQIAGITDAKSLRGFPVAVKSGDAAIELLRQSGVETLFEYGSYEAMLEAARDRKASVFVADLPPALYYLHKFGIQGEFRQTTPFSFGSLHRAVARENSALLQLIEDGFAKISPAEYKAIDDKWYGAESLGHRYLRWVMPVAAGFCGVTLLLFVWNRMLQRTVRRRTAELRASQALFQSIYHSVSDAIFIHDPETGRLVDVNERVCAMYRCSREEALSANAAQLSLDEPPYTEAEARAWLSKSAAGDPQTFPWRCRRKDGTLFWGEVCMRKAKIGSANRIVVTVRDRTEKQEEEIALRARLASQERLEAIADASPGFMFVRRRKPDGSHTYLYASSLVEDLFGIRHDELLRDGECLSRVVVPDDLDRMRASIAEAARISDEWTFSYRVNHPRKGLIWIDVRAKLHREPDGSTLWHGFSYDVTDRVNALSKLKKANAILQIRAACDQALVRADDEPTLLRTVCETAVVAGGYRMAWIGFAEDNEDRSVRPVSVSGHNEGYVDTVCISWHETKRGQGPVGTAIRTGRVVVAQDIANNPAFSPWQSEALKRGFASVVAIPISCDGKTIGMLAIYSALPADFPPDDVAAFSELVANLGVRLEAIRSKDLRLRAETDLRNSQEQLRATLDALPDMLFEVDRAGRVFDFRAPHVSALFIPPDSFLGRSFSDVLPSTAVSVIDQALAEAEETGRHFGGTYSLPMSDGTKWYELSISPKGEPGPLPRRYIVLVRDVTSRFQAEQSLRESERYNRTLFDQTPIGLMLCRMDGSLVDINPACARIIGYTVPEALQLTYWEITPRSYSDEEMQQLESLRTTGRYAPYEKHYIHKDGHMVPVRLTGLIIKQQGEDFIWSSVEDITERKQAEAALRLSADRLEQAVLVSQIGVFDHDHEAHVMYCSPVLRGIYGIGPDHEVSIRDYVQRVHPEDRDRLEKTIQRTLDPAGDGLMDIELRIVREGGEIRNVTTRAQTVFGGSGADRRPLRTVGAVIDITERKQAEAALTASTEQIEHVLGAADCLLWQSRLTRTEVGEYDWQIYIPRSSLYRKLFGKDPDTPSHLPWKALGVPELPTMHKTCTAALVSGAPGYEQEFHAVIDQQTVWLREQVSIKREGGTCWVLVGVITDITERRAAEATLRESEARLAGIIDSAMDSIITAGEDGIIVVFNHAAESVFRCSASTAIGRHIDKFIPKSQQAAHSERLRNALSTHPAKLAKTVSGFAIRADGTEFPCEASVSHVTVKGRRLFTVILRDVTERVRAETERKALQEQILRSQRLESVGRLAGGIAHDLNNILAPIVLGAPMLRESLHDADARDMLNAMEISANRGARIIAQLLTFSRGGVGERVMVELPLVVRDMETIIRETFPKNITVHVEIPGDIWPVRGDPTQLHQVLMNLCVNARDALPAGGTLTLTLSNRPDNHDSPSKIQGLQPGRHVCLSVTDSGTGIEPDVIDKIYDPFFTTKEVGKGTGLGLSTVLGIVQAHGGAVQARSRLGYGSQFDVYLPAADMTAPTPAGPSLAKNAKGNGELILFVDDESAVRLVGRRLLEQHGYRVADASDGSAALNLYKQLRPAVALVITDLIMPVLDGAVLIRELKKLDPALPIIAASGHAGGIDPAFLSETKFDALLKKPFEIADLLREVYRVLHSPTSRHP